MEDRSPRAEESQAKHAARRACVLRLAQVVALLCAATSLRGAPPPSSQQDDTFEHRIKAAFVYNFAKFVEWPDGSGDVTGQALVIGVLGDGPFGQTLDDAMRGKTVNGRPLAVKRFATIHDLEPCQVLIVSTSQTRHLPELLGRIRGRPILTISEGERFAQEGGMVRLLTEENKVRFEINVDAAEQAGLRISSKLLALARIVHGHEEKGP